MKAEMLVECRGLTKNFSGKKAVALAAFHVIAERILTKKLNLI